MAPDTSLRWRLSTQETNEPINECEFHGMPERCLLAGFLGMAWPLVSDAIQPAPRVVRTSGGQGRTSLMASVVDCGIIDGPDCHSVGVEKVDWRGHSGTCFGCGRGAHRFADGGLSRLLAWHADGRIVCASWVSEFLEQVSAGEE